MDSDIKKYSAQDILEAVKQSGCLGKSSRRLELLEYLLAENFAGRVDAIKEYNIAIDVFKRQTDFDPVTDSIVRSEMYRLRNNLEAFNNSDSEFKLTIPRGSYQTTISAKASSQPRKRRFAFAAIPLILAAGLFAGTQFRAPTPNLSVCSNQTPNLEVVLQSERSDAERVANHFIRSITAQYSSAKSYNVNSDAPDSSCAGVGTPLYRLDYEIVSASNAPQQTILLSLSHPESKKLLKTETISSKNLLSDAEYQIASFTSDTLKGNGILPLHAGTIPWKNKTAKATHDCMLKRYDFYVSDAESDYLKAMACLEEVRTDGFATADSLAVMAQLYMVEERGYVKKTVADPAQRAELLLKESKEINSHSSIRLFAKIMYEAENKDFNKQILENAVVEAINEAPFNTEVLIMIANVAGFKMGDWDLTKWASDRTLIIHNERDDSVIGAVAAMALMRSPANDVMEDCERVYSKNSGISNIILLACAGLNNDQSWANQTVEDLAALKFSGAADMIKFIKGRNYEPVLTDYLIRGIEKGAALAAADDRPEQ